jgi:two-component system sensor histidine kinase KdpD
VHHVRAALFSVAAVAAVTGLVFALRPVAPTLALGGLYVLAVLPVAILWGLPYAVAVAVLGQLVFNFFFLPPFRTLELRDNENWVAIAVNVVTAVVVSGLAARLVAAERVRRSDAIKTAVLRSVSHDLRSPLTAIRAASEGLVAEGVPPADRLALAETVRSETERLDRLVANLLDLSRLEAGMAEPHRELWTADSLAERALGALGADSGRVAVLLPDELPPVYVDAAQIERVLVNLLENALKFTPEPWVVELAVELAAESPAREPEAVVFRVVDHGPGVPEAERGRVFEAFERGSAGASRSGTGLGLAIAQGFADANGARLWVEAREPRGATFVLAVPAAARVRA